MKSSVGSAELWPYSERNGVFVDEAIAGLLNAPEVTLTDAEKQQAYDFADKLYEGRYSEELRAETPKSLEAVSRIQAVIHRQKFYTGYLDTAEGAAECATLVDPESAYTGQSLLSLKELVSNGKEVDAKARKLLAANSEKWYQKQMNERLLDDNMDASVQPDFESETVNFKPSVLLEKCRGVQAYRTFYNAVKRELKGSEPSPLETAKRVLVDVHLARANSMLAELYPGAVQLAIQLDSLATTDLTERWRNELYAVAPVISEAWKHQSKQDFATSFMQRLDRMRNGVGLDNEGKLTSISVELSRFGNDVEAAGEGEATDSRATQEVITQLEQTKWQADRVKQFTETILAEWGWLSNDQADWHEVDERIETATDKRWQVIISPKAVSLGIDSKKKVVIVPEDFDRPLLRQNPSGVLPVVAHELTHAIQSEYDEVVAEHIPLAKIKGRRTLTGKEMGGVQQESLIFDYFGQHRRVNTMYLRAFEAKIAGANQTQTAKAFMEARLATDPGATRTDAAKSAAKVTSRLYRHHGFNSQPLDYLEQGVMLRELGLHLNEDVIAAIAMAATSFSLHDSAALHRVDLLDVPVEPPKHPAEDVLRIYFDRFHEST
jgi:hypothetical protein